ncbi:MAG: dienelactone hydrolase family protein [Acidobacteriota bacterium]|nr:MAG: dienelactone hydrolase family protein [Acidobacteriota bacterium]
MRDELMSLLPEAPELSRRAFVVTSLTTGFALATQPISAQSVITTDTNGLIAGEVKIPVKGGDIPAYRAMPAKGRNFPTVLVVQEIFGVHEHIKDICRRFAKIGYLAVAPEMYARQGDVSNIPMSQISKIFEIVGKVPDEQVMSDLDAAAAWARKNNGSDRLAVTGFCWGGRIVWLYAAHNPKLKAGVAWYGRLAVPPQVNPLQPKHPVELAKDLKAPVLGLYAGKDQGIPLNTVEAMKQALKDAGKTGDIIVYPNSQHGFYADYRPSYDKESAQDGWKRLLEWFKKYGV